MYEYDATLPAEITDLTTVRCSVEKNDNGYTQAAFEIGENETTMAFSSNKAFGVSTVGQIRNNSSQGISSNTITLSGESLEDVTYTINVTVETE